jgi:predicted RNase H-like HicB family nuclease
MERTYLAFIHKDPDSSFGVTFPDLLGCTSGGDTFDDAREMAREALMLHLEGMADGGEYIPPPCSPDAALAHEDAGYAIALIVVEALPERTEEEARAEFEAFLASDEYQEIYGQPLTEEERLAFYEPLEEPSKPGIGIQPIPTTGADWTYAGLVRQGAAGDFGVSFPDLPGCFAAGATLEEACETARGALARHLKGLSANGEIIPDPRSADAVLARPDAADAVALTVVDARAAFGELGRRTAPEWEQDEAAMPAN